MCCRLVRRRSASATRSTRHPRCPRSDPPRTHDAPLSCSEIPTLLSLAGLSFSCSGFPPFYWPAVLSCIALRRPPHRPHARTVVRHARPNARTFSYMGLFPPGLGKLGAPQGPTSCAPGAPLIGQYCLLWGRENQQWPHPCVTCATQKPPGAYNPNSRQQHYTPPTLDSTQQFPQLGRTINNPHPTLPYPSLSDPHSTCTI